MAAKATPSEIRRALLRVFDDATTAQRSGDVITLDTPYPLLDAHLFQAIVEQDERGAFVVSDGGWAVQQATMFVRAEGLLRTRLAEMRAIAEDLDLEWDHEFRFVEGDLDAAMLRVSMLATAVDRALARIHAKPSHPRPVVRNRLVGAFREVGLKVATRVRIPVMQHRHVTVDYRLRQNEAEAAVELLTSRTTAGAAISVDRAIANFHDLDNAGYAGTLVAVYDSESPVAGSGLLDRFRSAKPERSLLLPDARAAVQVAELLAA